MVMWLCDRTPLCADARVQIFEHSNIVYFVEGGADGAYVFAEMVRQSSFGSSREDLHVIREKMKRRIVRTRASGTAPPAMKYTIFECPYLRMRAFAHEFPLAFWSKTHELQVV